MSYANGTTHYNLPQTVSTDKRDWTDTNQAFADVDAALHTASETASTAASNISTLEGQINTPSTGLADQLAAAQEDITSLDGRMDTAEGTITQHTTDISDVRRDCEDMVCAYNEPTATSAHAYSTGDFFIYNDILYKATDDIAIGDTIVPNTNCSATNVTTEVDAINTALSSVDNFMGNIKGIMFSTTGIAFTSSQQENSVLVDIPTAPTGATSCFALVTAKHENPYLDIKANLAANTDFSAMKCRINCYLDDVAGADGNIGINVLFVYL